MKHKLGLLAGMALLCAIACASSVNAQGVTRLCIPVYNSATGALSCDEGWLPKLLNALSTTVTSIKSSNRGSLGEVYCYNPNASVAYIQLFDVATAAAVTLGTTVPIQSFGIPSALASGVGPTAVGISFQNGLQAAVTTTATGNSALSTGVDCNVTYN